MWEKCKLSTFILKSDFLNACEQNMTDKAKNWQFLCRKLHFDNNHVGSSERRFKKLVSAKGLSSLLLEMVYEVALHHACQILRRLELKT